MTVPIQLLPSNKPNLRKSSHLGGDAREIIESMFRYGLDRGCDCAHNRRRLCSHIEQHPMSGRDRTIAARPGYPTVHDSVKEIESSSTAGQVVDLACTWQPRVEVGMMSSLRPRWCMVTIDVCLRIEAAAASSSLSTFNLSVER